MRDLLLMRGIPGSGKSSFVKENSLEPYTICPDNIRLMFETPIYDVQTGQKSISQKNDKKVWELINKLVEEKMTRGEFIVIDAMNIDISSWKKLAEKYRYHIWYKSFDVSLEECIKRNNLREEYKRVPEEVICAAYKRLHDTTIPTYAKEIDKDFFDGIKPLNMNNYNNIYVFGDIHGCFDPLAKFFEEYPFSEDNLYVFTGDYLDRGYQNKETLEFLIGLMNYKNVMFLEGNHNWEFFWSNNEIDKIRSNEFLINTVNQIYDVDKSKIRNWCRGLIQMAYLEYNNYKYFITHAGLGFFPGEKELRFVPTQYMIKNGKYEDDIDMWYDERETEVIQIHGHRNLYEYPVDKFSKSFNLNSAVEFGSPLRIMKISKEGHKFLHYENKRCEGRINPWKQNNKETDNIAITMKNKTTLSKEEEFVLKLRKSSDIVEKTLANGISSFNFKRDVFFSDKWNNLNKIARGLFIDSNCKIVARSYEKFFNYNEREKNTLEFLEKNLKFPVSLYMKYNGFLGLMSYDHNLNDLHFFSKSTDESDFAKWFRDIAINQFNRAGTFSAITEYLKNNNVTMVFEVIDPENDPHIIEYEHKRVWLLDIIDNTIEFHKKPYKELCEIAKKFNMSVKKKEVTIDNFGDLEYNLTKSFPVINPESEFEGFVFEDANGYMFKYKMPYYNFWKKMRGVKMQIQKGNHYGYDKLDDLGKEIGKFMEIKYTQEQLTKMSIIDVRNDFYKDCRHEN
jgi:predicted kinase